MKNLNKQKEITDQIPQLAIISSNNEVRAIKCEREVNKMKFAQYMEKHIGEKFIGFITSITNFGIFIQLENLVDGFCNIRNLANGSHYVFNQPLEELKVNGQTFCVGQHVNIEVISANKNTRQIEFKIIAD